MSRFGDILSELREDRGLTQKQLANAIHISSSSISAFETGYRTPNLEILISVAQYFNVTTDYLLGLTDVSVSPGIMSEHIDTDVTASDILCMLRKLSIKQRSAAVLIIKEMSFISELTLKTNPDGAHK